MNKNNMLSKVPQITLFFWIIKILTTGMGEVTSDFLARSIEPVVAVAISAVVLLITLIIQFSVKRYVAWIYWINVVMVSVFGTMAADVLHVGFGISYSASTIFFAIALAIVFTVWHLKEKTLSIHSIYTRRREVFYWLTVLTTFALGTAVGDMTASTMKLGYLYSGILFAGLFLIPVIAYKVFKLNEIFTFWFAYIVTRPLGASVADWMGAPVQNGGLGIGTGIVSLALTVIIFVLVGYMSISRKDVSDSCR